MTTVSGAAMRHVLAEIDTRVAATRTRAAGQGMVLRPPVLALGVSERVGSNWLSDRLRPALVQHNEPLRQQIGPAHPLSALNPAVADIADVELAGLARHWLVTFAVSKYATAGRHLVKETNLFFAVPALLRLFPQAPVVVLTRSPAGIASSFTRGGLWARWRYAERYAQLAATTRQARFGRWAALVPCDEPDDVTALTRLVVLNAVLLAEHLAGRDYTVMGYEQHVLTPHTALRHLAAALPEVLVPAPAGTPDPVKAGDDTFATAGTKTELAAMLSAGQAEIVRAETMLRLHLAADAAGEKAARTARGWLAGDHLYRIGGRPPPRRQPAGPLPGPPCRLPIAACYVQTAGVALRNLLITNAEYARLLDLLHTAGLPNSHAGTHLLLTCMPHGRGGRLHAGASGRWQVSPGYEHHPVYWVTWIGAAAYAAWAGARLPAHAELNTATLAAPPTNTSYTAGDTVAVAEPGRGPGEVHHLAGNVQVWCGDGPAAEQDQPVQRWLHGAAWNTPASREDITRLRSRHLLGSSRGAGVRLARDPGQQSGIAVTELAARLRSWTRALSDRDRPLTDLDQLVIDALCPSQANGGLRPHVRTGAREP